MNTLKTTVLTAYSYLQNEMLAHVCGERLVILFVSYHYYSDTLAENGSTQLTVLHFLSFTAKVQGPFPGLSISDPSIHPAHLYTSPHLPSISLPDDPLLHFSLR